MTTGIHSPPGLALDPGRVKTTAPKPGTQLTEEYWDHSTASLLPPFSRELPADRGQHKSCSPKCLRRPANVGGVSQQGERKVGICHSDQTKLLSLPPHSPSFIE